MDWREIWTMALGQPPPVYHLHPVLGSLLFYVVTFVICSSLRRLNKAVSPRPLREYIADFISTFQPCACSFENGNSLRLYGWPGLFMVLFTLQMVYANTFTDSCPSPVGTAKKFFQHRQSFLKTIVKVTLQAFSGYCSYQYVKHFWSLDLHFYHALRLGETQCYTYLSVSVLLGVLIEGGATLIDTLLSANRLVPWKLLNRVLISSFLTALVVSGLSLTGMFFHPAMASAQNFGCKGTSHWEHLTVYWLGPFLGCFIGVKVNSIIKKATEDPDHHKFSRKVKGGGNKHGKGHANGKMEGNHKLNDSGKENGRTSVRKRVNNNNNLPKSRNTVIKRNE